MTCDGKKSDLEALVSVEFRAQAQSIISRRGCTQASTCHVGYCGNGVYGCYVCTPAQTCAQQVDVRGAIKVILTFVLSKAYPRRVEMYVRAEGRGKAEVSAGFPGANPLFSFDTMGKWTRLVPFAGHGSTTVCGARHMISDAFTSPGNARLHQFVPGSQFLGQIPRVPFVQQDWYVGGIGSTCQRTCQLQSKTCNSHEMDKLTDPIKALEAFGKAGHACNPIPNFYWSAAIPFANWGGNPSNCFYVKPGWKTTCTQSTFGRFKPLCYCV